MKIFSFSALILFFVVCNVSVSAQFDQLPVKLLRTKRLDIERSFRIEKSNKWSLEIPTESGRFKVSFTTRRCDDGWDVEPDVVSHIRYEYSSETVKPPDDIQTEKYFFYTNDTMQQFFFDSVHGLTYELDSARRHVVAATKVPPIGEPTLRCQGFPAYNPISDRYPVTERISLRSDSASIDAPMTVAALRSAPSKRGYAFVYCAKDRIAECREAAVRLENT